MSRLKFQQKPGRSRGQGYFPQLEGLGRKLETFQAKAAPDIRLPEDHAERLSKRAEKLARRARAAGFR